MPSLPDFFHHIDVHSHRRHPDGSPAIVNIEPDAHGLETLAGAPAGALYSAGIHPWTADVDVQQRLNVLDSMCAAGALTAIGECGLDRRRGPAPDVQKDVFIRQLQMAEEYGLPVIIHAVGAYSDILALHKQRRPRVPWIIHGFRGKPQTAAQLVARGIYLSLNPRHMDAGTLTAPPCSIPPQLLLTETDGQEEIP